MWREIDCGGLGMDGGRRSRQQITVICGSERTSSIGDSLGRVGRLHGRIDPLSIHTPSGRQKLQKLPSEPSFAGRLLLSSQSHTQVFASSLPVRQQQNYVGRRYVDLGEGTVKARWSQSDHRRFAFHRRCCSFMVCYMDVARCCCLRVETWPRNPLAEKNAAVLILILHQDLVVWHNSACAL